MTTKSAPRSPHGPQRHLRDRVPDPRAEGAVAASTRSTGWPNEPAPSPGRTRSSWPPACNARSPPASPTAARAASARARFPARKSLEEFDFDHARRPQARRHRPPGHPGLRHCPRERGVPRPARHRQDPPGHRARDPGLPGRAPGRVRHRRRSGSTASPTPTTTVGCRTNCVRLGRYPLLIVDEVGYIPFEAEAANLFFQLVSSRYERASLIVTSNKPFGRWGEVFGDDVVAAAMIDRLVHHAEVIALKGDCYRLKDRDLGRVPANTTDNRPTSTPGVRFHPSPGGQNSGAVDTWVR